MYDNSSKTTSTTSSSTLFSLKPSTDKPPITKIPIASTIQSQPSPRQSPLVNISHPDAVTQYKFYQPHKLFTAFKTSRIQAPLDIVQIAEPSWFLLSSLQVSSNWDHLLYHNNSLL